MRVRDQFKSIRVDIWVTWFLNDDRSASKFEQITELSYFDVWGDTMISTVSSLVAVTICFPVPVTNSLKTQIIYVKPAAL